MWCTFLCTPIPHPIYLPVKQQMKYTAMLNNQSIGSLHLHYFLGAAANGMLGVMHGVFVPNPAGFEVLFYNLGLSHLLFPLHMCKDEMHSYSIPLFPTCLPIQLHVKMCAQSVSTPRFDCPQQQRATVMRSTIGYILQTAIEGNEVIQRMHNNNEITSCSNLSTHLAQRLCANMYWLPLPEKQTLERWINDVAGTSRCTDSKEGGQPPIEAKEKKRKWFEL